MGKSAESLHHDAVDLVNRGELAEAQRLLTRARARTTDADLLARIAGTIAVARARTGAIREAERTCEEALATPGLARETVAILEGQMGSIAGIAGRLDDADRWLSRAIARVTAPRAKANLLMNRSVLAMERRDLDRAAEDADAAAQLYQAEELDVDAAEARHNLGYIEMLRGDLIAAITEMTAARPTLATVSRMSAAICDTDRAEVLREAGMTREAEALLADAAEVFGQVRMPKERAAAEFHLAQSLLAHDPVRARGVAARASSRFRAVGHGPWRARADALALRAELAAGQVSGRGDPVPASDHQPTADAVADVVEELNSHGLRNDAAALRMSRQLWLARRGEPDTDRVRVPSGATLDTRLLAHELKAERFVARRRYVQARTQAARGLTLLLEWRQDFGSLDLQTSVAMHGHGLIGVGLRAAVRSGDVEAVFDWSERARHLSQQVVPLRPPPDEQLADDLAELRLLHSQGEEERTGRRAVELQTRARERQWAATKAAQIEERASLSEVQRSLDADTAALAFVFSAEGLGVLVITAEATRMLRLEAWPQVQRLLAGLRADLDVAASVRSSPLGDAVRLGLNDRLAALSRALLDQAIAVTDARRVVLTVPGVLNGIPWSMLPALRGRTFTIAVSLSKWARTRPRARTAMSAGFAIGPRVARAAEEVSAAARMWGTAPALDVATVPGATRLASEVDVLHIAAHGRHAADNPMFSGLELADGTLFGYDIDLIENVPDTVILSACEVGRSSVRWGEEAIGMTRVWLHSGARCVVAAPVVVADDDACDLLAAMHEGLAAGIPPSVALAEAAERTGIVAPFQVHGAGF
jgi:hypothetical protein